MPYDGRLHLGGVRNRYDIVDLSLADSTGLSHAGGFAIVEKYNYTVETLQDYMRALKPDGVLAITLWNKEDLPKSVPKLFATVAAAARGLDGDAARSKLFIFHTYLSTVTVLYKKNGFAPSEIAALKTWSEDMSWELLHTPGARFDRRGAARIWRTYRASHSSSARPRKPKPAARRRTARTPAATGGADLAESLPADAEPHAGRRVRRGSAKICLRHPAAAEPNHNRPSHFAAYIKALEIPHFLDQLEAVSDEWAICCSGRRSSSQRSSASS